MSNDNNKNLIKDPVFNNRGPVTDLTWQKLFCNSEANVSTVLARGGWDKKSPVVTPIISTEKEGSARVVGSRYAVRGNLADVTFNASTLWPQADKTVEISMVLKGEHFSFSGRSESLPSNFSDWLDCEESGILTMTRGEDPTVGFGNLTDDGSKPGLCMRLEVHVTSRDKSAIYLAMVPLPYTELLAKLDRWEVDPNSDRVPVALLKMGNGEKYGPLVADNMFLEPASDKSGFGIYPLIEQVTTQNLCSLGCSNLPTLPDGKVISTRRNNYGRLFRTTEHLRPAISHPPITQIIEYISRWARESS